MESPGQATRERSGQNDLNRILYQASRPICAKAEATEGRRVERILDLVRENPTFNMHFAELGDFRFVVAKEDLDFRIGR